MSLVVVTLGLQPQVLAGGRGSIRWYQRNPQPTQHNLLPHPTYVSPIRPQWVHEVSRREPREGWYPCGPLKAKHLLHLPCLEIRTV